jgi:hypothetical protein
MRKKSEVRREEKPPIRVIFTRGHIADNRLIAYDDISPHPGGKFNCPIEKTRKMSILPSFIFLQKEKDGYSNKKRWRRIHRRNKVKEVFICFLIL